MRLLATRSSGRIGKYVDEIFGQMEKDRISYPYRGQIDIALPQIITKHELLAKKGQIRDWNASLDHCHRYCSSDPRILWNLRIASIVIVHRGTNRKRGNFN